MSYTWCAWTVITVMIRPILLSLHRLIYSDAQVLDCFQILFYFLTNPWVQFGLTSGTTRYLSFFLNPTRIKLWTRIHSYLIHFWKKWYYETCYCSCNLSLLLVAGSWRELFFNQQVVHFTYLMAKMA
jgi:hypothetical protein